MTDATQKRTPDFGAVWWEQLRMVGLSVRRESLLALSALLVFCVAGVAFTQIPSLSVAIDGELNGFMLNPGEPGPGLVLMFVGLLYPLVVWKGERPWAATPMWSLPVDHRRHALTKVAAGWIWLMALLGAGLLAVVLAVLLGGGSLGVEETRQLITDEAGFFAGESGATRDVVWTTPWWEWVQPFTSATAAYLFVSTLLLATPHPLRWALAFYVFSYVPVIAVELLDLESSKRALELFAWFIGGDDFFRSVRIPDGDRLYAWELLPSINMWAAWSTGLIGMGIASVIAAARRARDY